MIGRSGIKRKLLARRLTIGSWLTLGHPAVAEVMARSGFDWLTVDMEHSVITIKDAQDLIRAIDASGLAALVRVGENNACYIKRAMDAGADGVIVPMVNTREDAERAVAAVKYPPIGTRGVGLARAQKYGLDFNGYRQWLRKESVVVVQIEHIDAVNNLEDILGTSGVDGSIIGPYDLSGSLGCPGEFDRPEVVRAINRYQAVCKRMRKPMGFHVVQPDARLARGYVAKGYTFLAVGLDTLFLASKSSETVRQVTGVRR